MEPVRTEYEDFVGNQIAVDLPFKDLVLEQLGKLPVPLTPQGAVETDSDLGLALITLAEQNLEAAAPALREKYGAGAVASQPRVYRDSAKQRAQRTPATIPLLDVLLYALRHEFGLAYTGWSPAMGKNRIADGVEGRPGVSGGGGGVPSLPDNSTVIPVLPDRPNAGRDIKVGILDTRLFVHPDLEGKHLTATDDLLTEKDLLTPSAFIRQAAGHATFIAGLIAKRAPRAELVIHHALDNKHATAPLWETARAMMEFKGRVDILNMSWIFLTADHEPSLILSRAIDQLTPRTLLVAAAGNHGVVIPQPGGPVLAENRPVQPAAVPGVVAVGAFDQRGKPATFSPKPAPWISLGAPGVDLVSAYLKGMVTVDTFDDQGVLSGEEHKIFEGRAQWSGTSFAAANVTGEIAARMTTPARRPAQDVLADLLAGQGADVKPYPHELEEA